MTKFLNRVFFLIPVFLTLASLNAFPQGAERLLQWTPESGISFNGESEYILVDKSEPFNVKALTVEAWVRFSDISGNQIFVNRGAASEDFTFYFYDGKIRMLVQDRTGYSHANADVPPAGVWFHCVGTFDENGVKKLYYNGILQATGKGAYRSIQSDNPLVIGALLGSSFFIERPFHGQMENIRIWNRALSENEIQQLLQTRHEEENLEELRDQGLIAYWAARSRQDDVVQDLSGNGNHGTFKSGELEKVVVQTVPAEGYQGIWYSNQASDDEYKYKYSGGLGTYCAKHRHHAIYAPEANKTFFVYGGTKGVNTPNALLIMISYYDHEQNMLARPVILQEKGTSDAHHNPVMDIDAEGYLWVFASAHGGKDGFIWKSTKPYSIEEFELVMQKEFTYPQPRFVEGSGFMFLFTKYTGGRELYVNTSPDGVHWGEDTKIAGFGGHYQISEQSGRRSGTAFNWHPPVGGLNARTNLYYMESRDFGKTWTTVDGKELQIPLDSPDNPALVHDYHSEGWLVYVKDIIFDPEGNPVILYNLSRGFESGPAHGARIFTIAHWQGNEWKFRSVAETDHNYDSGSIWIEEDGTWKVIAPTESGPQAFCTGGEVALWQSSDQGVTWEKVRQLTADSPRNHTYVRRVLNAHPDFYAFWADGDALNPSLSRLYFCNKNGEKVWVMPDFMSNNLEKPERFTSTNTAVK